MKNGISFSCINIYAKDPEKSFEFYKGLGFEVIKEGDPATDWYGGGFKLTDIENGPELWIWRNTDNRDIKNNIVLHCDDIQASYEALKAKGYAVSPPELQFYGDYEMNLTDADGNVILFLS